IWVSIILGIIIIMSVVLFFIFRKDTISPSTNPQQYPPINSGDIIRDGDSNKIETVGEDFVDIHNTDGLALLDYGPVLDYIFINNNSGIYIKNDGQIRTFEMSTGTTLGINTYDFITNDLYKINSTNTEQAKFSSKGKYLLLIGANKEAMLYKNSINNQFSSVKIFNKKGILEYTFSEDEKYLYYSLINNITGTTIYRLDLINNKEELIVNIPITEYTLYTYIDQILAKTKPSDEVLQNVFLLKNRNDYTNIISDQNNDNNDAFVRKNRKVFYKGIDLKVNTSLEKCNSNRVNIFCFTNNNQKTIDD
ncbi:MAG: hypothetical protein QM532_01915, partial [Cyanobium sp. MAG06]|nr:hypothetical protein [Cyanobium sp. MAG06]